MTITRRIFLGCGAANVLAAAVPPGERVTLGIVGCGWQGVPTAKIFLSDPRVALVAACDVDEEHLAEAQALVPGCRGYRAFEELLARPDIDAVYIAVPDHWHGIIATAALRAGKDVYGEKPLAHNWAEGRAIADAVRRYGRVWQTGSWQRSVPRFRHACELVRNGRLGRVHRVEVGMMAGHMDWDGIGHLTAPEAPPKTLDYNRWLGPAPEAPYCPARVHKVWRWILDYGGGSLLDWVGHHVDIAHWALGLDSSGPVEVRATCQFPGRPSLWNAPPVFRVTARYPGGLTMLIAGGHDDIRSGTKWIGEEGWLWVDREGIESHPPHLAGSKIGPHEIRLPVSDSHHRQFIDCVLRRSETLTPAHVALRSATPGYLGLIAMLTGETIAWDPERERMLNDSGAQRLLAHPMRAPWHL
jgi:predicted dehydrogenase